MGVQGWPDHVDEVLAGDQAVGLAYVTPAKGVVIAPLTNFAIRDRDAGTLNPCNTSVGVPKKLERIRANPQVALAYHTRAHASTARSEYVLVQGAASLSPPHPDYPRSIRADWERAGGPIAEGPFWDWWLRVFNRRVAISVAVERILVWPDLRCQGELEVHGAPLPAHPDPQRPPKNGTGPRVNHRRAAKRAARLPNRLVGWVGADGFPVVVPIDVGEVSDAGIGLRTNAQLVPPGGRRAGMLAHRFGRYTTAQNQRIHTGWMESMGDGMVLYAPHTYKGYRFPRGMLLFHLVSGAGTRAGLRDARRLGLT